ncbi:MAG: DUF3987 domain-containing protein [Bacteroidetes bacterium]|nr:DUF3987 domain-containing protein [Bacteroidota bacterium]
MAIYNSNLRQYERGESTTAPELPAAPPNHKLYIPANSSKTGIIKLIAENEGRGIIFETEGDSFADMLKQDYGNFSDVLRKAFHHEPVSYYRKTHEEEVEIKTPHFSIVLSGTYDQLFKLIPQTENGLYSRFCFYILQGDREFANPFEQARSNRKPLLEDIGRRWLEVYKQLDALRTPLRFVMPKYQEEKFWLIMKQRKAEVMDNISYKLEGMMHRMGVIFFRTAMILSVLRRYDTNEGWQKEIVCTDTDFELAFEITLWFLQYSLKVYELLPESHAAEEEDKLQFRSKEKDREECCRQYRMGLGTREIARALFGGKKSTTINNWINKYCKKAG